MDSKIFKLIDLILLPVFIVMLDFVSTSTIFSSTRIIVGIFTILYLLYAGVVYVLEEMSILQRNIVNFYDQMLYDLSDKYIITSSCHEKSMVICIFYTNCNNIIKIR